MKISLNWIKQFVDVPEKYSPKELETIILNGANKLKVTIDKESIKEISFRARGTPRIALKLLKRVRDYAQVKREGKIDISASIAALLLLEIDEKGLDPLDIRFLKAIIEKHNGGPVGIETIASTISEDIGTIEDIIEPYLLQIGFLKRTARGRVATIAARTHIGLK